MKKTFSITLIIFGIVFGFAQNGKISGKLVLEVEDDFELIAGKTKVILLIGNEKIIEIVDNDLKYSFENLKSDSIRLWLEPPAIGNITTYISFLEPNQIAEFNIPYSLTCKYDKSENNKTCPICEKQDKVIPIIYGLIARANVSVRKEESGNEKKTERKSYEGGCVISVCDPNWYCERDELEF